MTSRGNLAQAAWTCIAPFRISQYKSWLASPGRISQSIFQRIVSQTHCTLLPLPLSVPINRASDPEHNASCQDRCLQRCPVPSGATSARRHDPRSFDARFLCSAQGQVPGKFVLKLWYLWKSIDWRDHNRSSHNTSQGNSSSRTMDWDSNELTSSFSSKSSNREETLRQSKLYTTPLRCFWENVVD